MLQKLLRSSLALDGLKIGRVLLVGRHSSTAAQGQTVATTVEQDNITGSEHTQDLDRTSEETEKEVNQPRRSAYLNEQEEAFAPYRYVYPEFLPDPTIKNRNKLREKLERMDMLKRRSNVEIPEFYVGSILSVTAADRNAPGKSTTFVGICTERQETGLRSKFVLRNIVDGHGVEICYDLYNPTILNITCLRLERRLDDNLRYLRDADPKYSTFPFDMVPELRSPDAPVPINPLKVKLNPRPWHAKWQLWNLKGVEDLTDMLNRNQTKKLGIWKEQTAFDYQQYDLMNTYRSTIHAEDQAEIYSEIHQQLAKLTASLRKQKKKRSFVKPQKIA